MKTVASENQPKSSKDKRAAGGLSSQFFTQLIKLESDIANKTYTAETLDELTQIYAQCVEYYDSVHDHISSYFIFKIQDILATKKALKLLTEGHAKANAEVPKSSSNGTEQTDAEKPEAESNGETNGQAYKIQVNGAEGQEEKKKAGEHSADEEDEHDEDEEIEFKRRKTEVLKNRPARQSITAMKNKKQKLFSLHLKMQSEKATVKQSLQDVMASFGGNSQENDVTVSKDINAQRRRIQERIENKKRQNLTNYTQNMTAGFLNIKYADEDNKSMDSLLKGLEEEEFLPSQINTDLNTEPSGFNVGSNIMNDNVPDFNPEKSNNTLSDGKETSLEKKEELNEQNEEENTSEPKTEEKQVEVVEAVVEQEEAKDNEENNVVEELASPSQEGFNKEELKEVKTTPDQEQERSPVKEKVSAEEGVNGPAIEVKEVETN